MPNPLYTSILNIYDLVWFGLVLWHINHCRLFNAKSSLFIQGIHNKFPGFFHMGTFIDSTHMKL